MARYDKYDPISGGFRAPLAAAIVSGDVGKLLAVGLDANGRVVKGSGQTGVKGVYVPTEVKNAGDTADVMTDGEVVDCTGLAAGTNYYGTAAGATSTVNTDTYLGCTVEATRLVVRAARK